MSQTLYSKRMDKEIARLDREEKRLKMRAKEIARTNQQRGKPKEEENKMRGGSEEDEDEIWGGGEEVDEGRVVATKRTKAVRRGGGGEDEDDKGGRLQGG